MRDRKSICSSECEEEEKERDEMAPPVLLKMDVHCYKCAKKIKKAILNLRGTYSLRSYFLTQVDAPIDLTRELRCMQG